MKLCFNYRAYYVIDLGQNFMPCLGMYDHDHTMYSHVQLCLNHGQRTCLYDNGQTMPGYGQNMYGHG